MPCHDWICSECEHVVENIVTRRDSSPESVLCQCGGEMHIHFGRINFNNHLNTHRHNKMYGKEYHHGFGTVVKSYEHKQELLKEYGLEEAADPVNGSRSWRDVTPPVQTQKGTERGIEMDEEGLKEFMKQNS